MLGTLALVLLVVAGVGAAIGGLYPMDPLGTSPEQYSATGKMHGVGFMLGVPGTLLAITAAAVWITMIVFGASMATLMGRGVTGPAFVIGWQNRALVFSWAAWVFLVAWRLRASGA